MKIKMTLIFFLIIIFQGFVSSVSAQSFKWASQNPSYPTNGIISNSAGTNGNLNPTNVNVKAFENNASGSPTIIIQSTGGASFLDVAVTPCDENHDLMVGYNRATRVEMICDYDDGAGSGWVSKQAIAFSSNFPAGSTNNENDCTMAGGDVIAIDSQTAVCRFNESNCPAGWSQYDGWSTWSGSYGPQSGTHYCSLSQGIYIGKHYNLGCNPSKPWGNNPGSSQSCDYHTIAMPSSYCGGPTKRYASRSQIGCY